MVEMGQNDNLIKQPTKEEVKKAVFGLNGDSVGGPDCFNECFYQTCWEIISEDIFYMVRAFLNVQELLKFVTHTNLVFYQRRKK